jgi:hypothetical protein
MTQASSLGQLPSTERRRILMFENTDGFLEWSGRNGQAVEDAEFRIEADGNDADAHLVFRLAYKWRQSDIVDLNIQLQSTSLNFGGQRFWFSCPQETNGMVCGNRVGKLYLPPNRKPFGCRACHRLTYSSSQQAHRIDRQNLQYEKQCRRFRL